MQKQTTKPTSQNKGYKPQEQKNVQTQKPKQQPVNKLKNQRL